MKHVFISYSRADTPAMQRLARALRQSEIKVWTDEKLTPGTPDWQTSIQKAIEAAGAVVVLLSPEAKTSEWVGRELTYAQMRKLLIMPLLLRGDTLNAVPFQLVNAQWLDMRNDNAFDLALAKLTQALKAHLSTPKSSKFELIHEELQVLFERIPEIVSVGLISVDGLTIGFSSRSPNAEADRLSAMAAATLSLGERIAGELGAGTMDFTVITGNLATIFQLAVGDEAVLIAIVEGSPSIDQTLPKLRLASEKLTEFV